MNFLKNTNNIVLLLLLVVITSLCVLRRTGVVSTAVYFDYAITLILLMAYVILFRLSFLAEALEEFLKALKDHFDATLKK